MQQWACQGSTMCVQHVETGVSARNEAGPIVM